NPYTQIHSAKFQEVQKYLSITGHVYTPAYALTSDEHFGKLPQDVQDILLETAQETQAYVYETTAAMENDLLEEIKKADIEVNEADKDAFIASSARIYDEFAASFDGGAELVEAVRAVAD